VIIHNNVKQGVVVQLLPNYLKYEIKFASGMRMKLVSRLMAHLGNTAADH